MQKIHIKYVLFILVLVLLFTSCDSKVVPIEATGPQSPISEIEGFYEQQQIVSGGNEASGLNLSDIKIEKVDTETTEIVLSFAKGSQGEDKSVVSSDKVPKYSTSFLQGLNRMVLTMEGVSYFTYKIYEDELASTIVSGIFAQRPIDSEISNLYINLSTDYAYKVQEVNNQIIITMHNILNDNNSTAYYVTIDAYDDFADGRLGDDFPMNPTLCSDGENVLLISNPFETRSEAEEFISKMNVDKDNLLIGKDFGLSELKKTELPIYNNEQGLREVASTPIAFKDDNPVTFEPLITNGRYLCTSQNEKEIAYSQPNTIYGDQEGDSLSFEYLNIMNIDTRLSERILDYQFTSITTAEFSSDSKYLAFIEQDDVLRTLHILSLEDGKLYIPSEDGFGIDTASFVWGDDSNILYAINGEFQSKQLLSYDLTNPDDVIVSGVFEQEFSESIIQLNGSKIYYANRITDSMDSEICRVDILDGQCDKIANGNTFLLSPNGSGVVIDDIQIEDGEEVYRLRYIDIVSKEEIVIYTGQIINNITWSSDSKRIYYSIYNDQSKNSQYPYALNYYDVQSNTSVYMMDTITSALYPSFEDDEVLLMCVFTYKNKPVPVTYIVK